MLVITDQGEKLGLMSKSDAIREAQRRELDLFLVSPDSKPPVAKMVNYSKFRYDQQKKVKEMKRNQKVVQVKEIRLSPTIQKNDLETKIKNAQKFLIKGDKVKVSLRFYGRMITHQDIGHKVMNDFASELETISTVESPIKFEGRSIVMVLAPKQEK